jgi:hypothetical protein
LLGDDLAESRRAAEELVSRYPDSLAHRTTLALACYRMNDTAAARRVYEGRDYDWRLALPGHRAVYAAVLAANGQAADARNQVRTIPREHLRQEELELVRPLLE